MLKLNLRMLNLILRMSQIRKNGEDWFDPVLNVEIEFTNVELDFTNESN